ncbi:4-hydroxy-tetrahydrodipicolinate synthase [Candidatus Altiarchaeales archaeon WOR_SM1_SCG]|nr:4-hydroxy-tetrahydrodipicolinate synthase [Candidatus Altiarchaeales archaeon WOR_SM1_SCG]
MNLKIKGSIPALITPFKKSGIDEEGLRQNVEFQIENNSSAVLTVGTTGESPTVTPEEHKRITEIAVDQANGRVPVIAGTGSNSTDEAIEYTKHAEDCGADASLQVSPYYNKPTQEGLYRHFKAIAEAVNIPLILYNIQGRTAVNITPETILRLSKINNIIGVKEASGSIDQVSKILMLTKNENFVLLSGDDSMTLPMMALGGVGVVSVVANIVPKETAELVRLCDEENFSEARKIHYKLLPLIGAMFIETNPAPVKFAMNELKMPAGELRLPMVFPGEENKEKIRRALKDFGLL